MEKKTRKRINRPKGSSHPEKKMERMAKKEGSSKNWAATKKTMDCMDQEDEGDETEDICKQYQIKEEKVMAK